MVQGSAGTSTGEGVGTKLRGLLVAAAPTLDLMVQQSLLYQGLQAPSFMSLYCSAAGACTPQDRSATVMHRKLA